MGNQKFEIGETVRVKQYKVPKGVAAFYGGKIGKITGTEHKKGRLWYKASFGPSFGSGDFTSSELTKA